MKNKIVGIFVCTLMISTTILPIIGATPKVDIKPITANDNGLIDNIYPINLHDSFLKDIIQNILAFSHPEHAYGYLMVYLENHNSISIYFDIQLTVTKKDGTTIYDATSGYNVLSANSALTYDFDLSRKDLINHNSLIGFCTITFKMYIYDDGSEKTITVNGFFYNFGLKIIKPT